MSDLALMITTNRTSLRLKMIDHLSTKMFSPQVKVLEFVFKPRHYLILRLSGSSPLLPIFFPLHASNMECVFLWPCLILHVIH